MNCASFFEVSRLRWKLDVMNEVVTCRYRVTQNDFTNSLVSRETRRKIPVADVAHNLFFLESFSNSLVVEMLVESNAFTTRTNDFKFEKRSSCKMAKCLALSRSRLQPVPESGPNDASGVREKKGEGKRYKVLSETRVETGTTSMSRRNV